MASMKVLVLDGLAAGRPADAIPRAFARRHELLRRAVVADLAAVPGVEVISAPDPAHAVASGTSYALEDGAASYTLTQSSMTARWPGADPYLASCILAADAVWPLALESGGTLASMSYEILRANRVLLGSAPAAVEATSSKLKLTQLLADRGIATAATYSPHTAVPQVDGPWVAKPDDGAGCMYSWLFCDRAAALAWVGTRSEDGYVLQPFVAGKPCSLSLVCCDGMARVLACNQERVAMRDNRFHVLGSVVNGLADDDGAFARLGQQVAATVPGLWGLVGVDFVLTARGPVVLDINPRLCSAYPGLHASIGCNPAGLVIELLRHPVALPVPIPPGRRRAVSVDTGLA